MLGGSPGVFSARWSGRSGARADVDRANVDLLLAQVSDVPDEHRGAGFVCAVALVLPDGTEVVEHGEVRGTLERAPRGSGGFGYDPVLRVEGGDRTLAEYAPEEKNAISHRGRAVRALLPALLPVLEGRRLGRASADEDGARAGRRHRRPELGVHAVAEHHVVRRAVREAGQPGGRDQAVVELHLRPAQVPGERAGWARTRCGRGAARAGPSAR